MQRPSAKELLQHRFVKYARKTSHLTELTERYQEWRIKSPRREKEKKGGGGDTLVTESGGSVISNWEFETVRSVKGLMEREEREAAGTRKVSQVGLSLHLFFSRSAEGR